MLFKICTLPQLLGELSALLAPLMTPQLLLDKEFAYIYWLLTAAVLRPAALRAGGQYDSIVALVASWRERLASQFYFAMPALSSNIGCTAKTALQHYDLPACPCEHLDSASCRKRPWTAAGGGWPTGPRTIGVSACTL
jgi:hypothetical protein